ncbi:MAG: TfoX/Sxy family protein [Pseudomonadota bacterium]
MAVSDAQIAHAVELFEGVGPLTTRKMFGGLGIYAEGKIFAVLMSDGRLRLKGAGAMVDVFDENAWERWTYQREGSKKVSAMPYWTLPDALLDDPDAASGWARRALAEL